MRVVSPAGVTSDFFDKFRTTPNDIMESVYNRPFPNRYLASVAYFLADYMTVDYVASLVTGSFFDFFRRNIRQYDYLSYPTRFVGSLAYRYAEPLRDVAKEFGVTVDKIEETAMRGLIDFHSLVIDEP